MGNLHFQLNGPFRVAIDSGHYVILFQKARNKFNSDNLNIFIQYITVCNSMRENITVASRALACCGQYNGTAGKHTVALSEQNHMTEHEDINSKY